MRAGHSRIEITPGPDCPLIGYDQRFEFFPNGGNLGVNDPLHADCAVFDCGRLRVVLITLDLCIIETPLADRLRRSVGAAAGIPPEAVVIACSHTHSGPYPWEPGWMETEPVPPALHDVPSQRYAALLESRLIGAAALAAADLLPARFSLRSSTIGLGYRRRVKLSHGIGMAWNLREWDGPEPAPADDPALQLLHVTRDGAPDLLIWNTASHPVVLGKRSNVVSADWPGAVRALIEAALPDCRAMFLHGAGGDAHPWLATGDNPDDLRVVAAPVAALIRLLAAAPPCDGIPAANAINFRSDEFATALRLGPARLIALPCEIFGATGAAMRGKFPDLLIATTANGWRGYWPPGEAFDEGGYEVDAALSAGRRRVDCERLARAAQALLQGL